VTGRCPGRRSHTFLEATYCKGASDVGKAARGDPLRFPGGYAEHAPQPVQTAGHGAEGDLGVGTVNRPIAQPRSRLADAAPTGDGGLTT
jgi:hypothetical protein